MWPALASFVLRIAAFALIMVDQSPVSIAVFALVFGFTFLMTAPLLVDLRARRLRHGQPRAPSPA